MLQTRDKPGVGFRAAVVFFILNLPIIGVTYFAYWMAGGQGAEWFIRGVLAIGVAVAEFALVTTTIGPPLVDWIKSTETYDDGANSASNIKSGAGKTPQQLRQSSARGDFEGE